MPEHTFSVGIELEVGKGKDCCDRSGYRPCPNPVHRATSHDCPECSGAGRVRCPRCEGSGGQWCEACNDFHDCIICRGSGLVRCPQCQERFSREESCSLCRGSRFVVCGCDNPNSMYIPSWADDARYEHCGVELRGRLTYRLTYPETVERLLLYADEVAKFAAGRVIPDDAGLHVHVSARTPRGYELNERRVERIVKVWSHLRLAIRALADVREARETYCLPNWDYPKTFRDFISEFDNDSEYEPGQRNWARQGRYYELNAWHAWTLHRTVEFRLWNSTDDPGYVARALVIPVTVVATALTIPADDLDSQQAAITGFMGLLPPHPSMVPVMDMLRPLVETAA